MLKAVIAEMSVFKNCLPKNFSFYNIKKTYKK